MGIAGALPVWRRSGSSNSSSIVPKPPGTPPVPPRASRGAFSAWRSSGTGPSGPRRIGVRLLLERRRMSKPIDGAPTSEAPRFAASMIPGPPPVAMTLSRSRRPDAGRRRAPGDPAEPACFLVRAPNSIRADFSPGVGGAWRGGIQQPPGGIRADRIPPSRANTGRAAAPQPFKLPARARAAHRNAKQTQDRAPRGDKRSMPSARNSWERRRPMSCRNREQPEEIQSEAVLPPPVRVPALDGRRRHGSADNPANLD